MQTIYLDISNKGVIPTVYAKRGDVGRKFEVVLTDSGLPYVPTSGSAFSVWYAGASGEGNYTDIGDKSAFSANGNKVAVEMISQMLLNDGDGVLSLALNDPNGNQISTWNIPYVCEFVPGANSEEAKSYYTAFSKTVEGLPYPDTSLSVPGKAADAEAVGTALAGKASAGSVWTATDPNNDGNIVLQYVGNVVPGGGSGGSGGASGADGFSPIATVVPTEDGALITITDKNGTTAATVYNGKDGERGADGKSAYQYAKDGGFKGTEEEFAEKMASSSGYPAPCVMDYGAKGDGNTDDTVAFQTAIAENRVVFVPGGTYKLSGELLIRGNCELEISQDTVLEFTQTTGNCISMEMSASIRGHHGLIKVPYAFAGNVINVTTALNQDVTAVPPWNRWDPMWKAGRYITDLNITKHDSKGFCYANQPGDCKGTAIYISADRNGTSANRSTFIWGLDFSGIRIAGAFSYGIRAVNFNKAWNHEMRIAAFITCCEIGVSLEDCNNAYISAAIEPRYAEDTSGKITGVYAKHGIQLIRSTNADLTGSRVWDWNATGTLWTDGGQYQHIGMYGDCHGAILNSFEYYDVSTDIRKLIYTDTASNLEKLTILQEPITRWFKPKDNKPYFFDGDNEKELLCKEDFDACFKVDKTPTYTDALANAIDTDGTIYEGIGYSRNGGTINGSGGVNTSQAGYYGHTGFIAVHDGSIVRVDGIKLTDNGDVRIAAYDSNFKLLESRIHNAGHIISGSSYWFPDYVETETGFSFRVSAYSDDCAYIRMGLLSRDIASNPTIAVDEELGYTMDGYLDDSIKVKGKNVVGGTGGGVSSWNDLTDKPFDIVELMPETQFVYDQNMGYFLAQTDFNFVIGQSYVINWNGAEYTCTAKYGMINNEICATYVGNDVLTTEENNGFPFVLATIPFLDYYKGMIGAIPLDGSAAIAVSIKGGESSVLYKRPYEPLVLDGRLDDSDTDLAVIFGDDTEVMNAFFAGREIVVIGFGTISARYTATGYVPHSLAGTSTDGNVLILYGGVANQMKQFQYNGDGTYVPYSD